MLRNHNLSTNPIVPPFALPLSQSHALLLVCAFNQPGDDGDGATAAQRATSDKLISLTTNEIQNKLHAMTVYGSYLGEVRTRGTVVGKSVLPCRRLFFSRTIIPTAVLLVHTAHPAAW